MGALKKHQHFGPSRSDFDWRAAKALKNFAGFIFVCSKSTVPDLDRGIFGLPGYYEESVRNIHRGMPLFLFDHTTRRLYGIFEAASDGGYNIDPLVWENKDQSKCRHANAVSKYPAQVKVSVRAERPALEEESLFSILDYDEGSKFRLALSALQVQQLLDLFDEAQAAKIKCLAERNRLKNNQRKAKYRKPKSPQSTTKSDSESYNDCSSQGLNSCEDEFTDEVVHENFFQNGDQEQAAGERLSQIILDTGKHCDKRHLKLQGTAVDKSSLVNHRNRGGACKRSVPKPPYSGSDSENLTLSRLQETDPAVNSNSYHFVQTGVDQSGTPNRPDSLVKKPMSQVPFACGETVIFVPVQSAPPHQRENLHEHQINLKQRSKSNESKKHSRVFMNSRKQGFNQERCRKLRGARNGTQEHWSAEIVAAQPQNSQHLATVQQDQAHHATLSFLEEPPNPDILTYGQQQNIFVEDGRQGIGVPRNVQVLPEELCDLQNSDFPILVIPEPLPATQPLPITARFVEGLHSEILQFARWTRPSLNIKHDVEAAINCVREGVRSIWPEADIEVFGSFATGLCLQHSDVDLAVIDAPPMSSTESVSIAQASAVLIRELAAALQAYEWCESIKPLDTASMPVLKCLCRPSGTLSSMPMTVSTVAVDITIGGIRNSFFSWNPAAQVLDVADCNPLQGKSITRHTGGAARDYVLHKIQELPALAPLVLLLKSFLHHKNLSNVYQGGLGSFSLTLLVAFYLERVPAIREFFPDRGVYSPFFHYTSLPVPGSLDHSEDFEEASTSCSQGTLRGNSEIDYSGHSLGERYVRTAADAANRVLSFWDQDGSPYLGTLLLGFLLTFGFERDLSREKIVLKGLDGSPGGFFKRDDRHVALWIDDPLRPGVNIGAGSFGMVHVQTAFKELLQSVTKHPVFIPPLQCEDRDCHDLEAFSKLVHIGCIVVADDEF